MMKYDLKIINRMKRVEGQIKGVLRMMEEEKDCRDVVTQLSAIRSAIDRTVALIVSQNLERCIREDEEKGGNSAELIEEAVQLLMKSR